MPEYIEIKDEIFKVSSINYTYCDVFPGKPDRWSIVIGLNTKQEHLIYFDDEDECSSEYLKIKDSLLKNTKKLNS